MAWLPVPEPLALNGVERMLAATGSSIEAMVQTTQNPLFYRNGSVAWFRTGVLGMVASIPQQHPQHAPLFVVDHSRIIIKGWDDFLQTAPNLWCVTVHA